jgi:hypothetical protein
MTVKRYFLTALLGLFVAAHAQTSSAQTLVKPAANGLGHHTVYLGAFGGGLLFSANYEFRFRADQLGWGIHAGIGGGPGYKVARLYYTDDAGTLKEEGSTSPLALTIPFGVNYLIGRKGHRVEFGVGATYMNADAAIFDEETTKHTWMLTATVAYRYYFRNGLMLRAGITPVLSVSGSGSPIPWPDGGIGIRF